tara:strand:- start:5762 stop:6100 length:339 start_codon:yes stop_codon:yes gene_type:complete
MIDISSLGDLAVQILLGVGGAGVLLIGMYVYSVTNKKEETKPSNYKNIALMAKNLSVCKPSSREAVLTELYNSSEWTSEEVDELKRVLEGMLRTKLFITKPGEKPNKGLKAI